MDYQTLENTIYEMNEDELFYQDYYYARQQEYSLQNFIANLDMNRVLSRHLLVQEIKETIPLKFEDYFFFDAKRHDSIIAMKHNRFAPALLHDHTFFEIIYVYDGNCEQQISSNSINLSTGDICIIPPGIKHSIGVFNQSIIINCLIRKSALHNVFYSFLNNPNILSSFFLNNIYSENGNDYIIFHTGNDHEIRRSFLYMYWESINKDLYWDQMISHNMMLTFGLLIRIYEKSAELPTFTQKSDVQRFALLTYIQDNYASITLEQIAEKFHYTPEHTSRLIKQTTGKTFTQILQQIRIEHAQILLHDSNMTVDSIAHEVGYETTEHFIRLFKKQIKLTPTEYRKSGIIF